MAKVNVRYIVNDVAKAIAFYEKLGFLIERHPDPGFAIISKGQLQLLLSRPGARVPAPGGWNRIQLEFDDLPAAVARLERAGCRFRGEIATGRGGKQILIDDPSGNPVELFEP